MLSAASRSFDFEPTIPQSQYPEKTFKDRHFQPTQPGSESYFQETIPGQISGGQNGHANDAHLESKSSQTHHFFSDTISTLPDGSIPKYRHQPENLNPEKMTQLLKRISDIPAANDPYFNPTSALLILHKVKRRLLKMGHTNFACMIETDEQNFLESYTRGMGSLVPNPTTNVVNYRKAKISQIKLTIHEGRIEQIQTAKLQLELRHRWLNALKVGQYPQLKTREGFQTWAIHQAKTLSYKKFTDDELRFIVHGLHTYTNKLIFILSHNGKVKNLEILNKEIHVIERSIHTIDTEARELRQTMSQLKKDENFVREREMITHNPNVPLQAFPLDTLKPGEEIVIHTDMVGICIIKSLSEPFVKNGEYFYKAIINWNTSSSRKSDSRMVLIRAPLVGYLDIRDLNGSHLDYLVSNPLQSTSKGIVLPKILKKTTVNIPKPTKTVTTGSIFGKVKKFFGKLFA